MSRADDWEKYSEADRWRAIARDVDDLIKRQQINDEKLTSILRAARGALITAFVSLVLIVIQRF